MTTNLSRLLPTALAAALALFAAGCLEKETRSTAYVEDDGTVTWVVIESEVQSHESHAEDARREEGDYLSAYRSGTAPVPAALAAIGGRDVRAEVLRDRVPFETMASARFTSLEHLARSFCDAAGWTCDTATVTTASQMTWSWTVPVSPEGDNKGVSPVDALSDALGTLRIVVSRGRLVAVRGFELDGDHAATLVSPEDEKGETFTFSLTWERGDNRAAADPAPAAPRRSQARSPFEAGSTAAASPSGTIANRSELRAWLPATGAVLPCSRHEPSREHGFGRARAGRVR